MYRLRHVLLGLTPAEAEKALSGEAIPAPPEGVMHGDIVHVYAGKPLDAIVGEFMAGTPQVRGGREYLAVLWPRRYLKPLAGSDALDKAPGFTGKGLREASWELLSLLEERRCESQPRAAAVVYGVEECVFCRYTEALLTEAFGGRCVHLCDVTYEGCFDRYEGLLEELFPGKNGVPLTLGRYGEKYWAAYAGLGPYDLERIYRLLSEVPGGGLLAYLQGRARVYRSPPNTLSNSSENTL